jgi:hypothetical protein
VKKRRKAKEFSLQQRTHGDTVSQLIENFLFFRLLAALLGGLMIAGISSQVMNVGSTEFFV